MSTEKIQTNYPEFSAEDIPSEEKYVRLRSAPIQGEDPLTWQQIDNNFEILKYTVNSVIDDFENFRISTSLYVKDEIIITWEEGVTDEQKQEILDAYTLKYKYELVSETEDGPDRSVYFVGNLADAPNLIGPLTTHAYIVKAELNFIKVPLDQDIVFLEIPTKDIEDPTFQLVATSSAGLPVTFESLHPEIAVVTPQGQVTILTDGVAIMRATQGGNADYNAAPQRDRKLTVTKIAQTIEFGQLDTVLLSKGSFTLDAVASSGLPVTYTVDDATIASVNEDNNLDLLTGGQVIVTASQEGNDRYQPADPVEFILNVSDDVTDTDGDGIPDIGDPYPNQSGQYITWDQDLSNLNPGDEVTLTATASSGLDVLYSSSNINVAIATGNSLAILNSGQANITAVQIGNNEYVPAQNVSKLIAVNASQTIIWDQNFTDVDLSNGELLLTATSSEGLPITYSASNTTSDPELYVTIDGNKLTLLQGADSTVGLTITANQAGDPDAEVPVLPASLSKTITIVAPKQAQTITAPSTFTAQVGDTSIDISPNITASTATTLTSSDSTVVTVEDQVLSFVGEGTATITITAEETDDYLSATATMLVTVTAVVESDWIHVIENPLPVDLPSDGSVPDGLFYKYPAYATETEPALIFSLSEKLISGNLFTPGISLNLGYYDDNTSVFTPYAQEVRIVASGPMHVIYSNSDGQVIDEAFHTSGTWDSSLDIGQDGYSFDKAVTSSSDNPLIDLVWFETYQNSDPSPKDMQAIHGVYGNFSIYVKFAEKQTQTVELTHYSSAGEVGELQSVVNSYTAQTAVTITSSDTSIIEVVDNDTIRFVGAGTADVIYTAEETDQYYGASATRTWTITEAEATLYLSDTIKTITGLGGTIRVAVGQDLGTYDPNATYTATYPYGGFSVILDLPDGKAIETSTLQMTDQNGNVIEEAIVGHDPNGAYPNQWQIGINLIDIPNDMQRPYQITAKGTIIDVAPTSDAPVYEGWTMVVDSPASVEMPSNGSVPATDTEGNPLFLKHPADATETDPALTFKLVNYLTGYENGNNQFAPGIYVETGLYDDTTQVFTPYAPQVRITAWGPIHLIYSDSAGNVFDEPFHLSGTWDTTLDIGADGYSFDEVHTPSSSNYHMHLVRFNNYQNDEGTPNDMETIHGIYGDFAIYIPNPS